MISIPSGALSERAGDMDMKRSVVIHLATACYLCAASSAFAHHSHPYFYDQCKRVAVEGRVESVQWKDPHTLIVVRLDDGAAYTVDWNSLSSMTTRGMLGPAQAALVPGARIAVTGAPIRSAAEIRTFFPEFKYEVSPNVIDPTLIRRVGDSWSWSRTPADRMPDAPLPQCAEPTRK
jgi:hypothetical protein